MYDEIKTCGEGSEKERGQSLVELMRDTHGIANDVCNFARKINGLMWGNSNEKDCDKGAPTCFREELLATKATLMATAEELSKMSALLGL